MGQSSPGPRGTMPFPASGVVESSLQTVFASPSTVGESWNSDKAIFTPNSRRIAETARAAWTEVPPIAKKFPRTSIRSMSRDLAPDPGDRLFRFVSRRDSGSRLDSEGGKGIQVHLAVGAERSRRDRNDEARKHIGRQSASEGARECVGVELRGVPGLRYHVCDEAPFPRIVRRCDDDAPFHLGKSVESRRDLAQLDAVSAYLDLVVHSPEELQVAVRGGSAPCRPSGTAWPRAPRRRDRRGSAPRSVPVARDSRSPGRVRR